MNTLGSALSLLVFLFIVFIAYNFELVNSFMIRLFSPAYPC